VKKRRKGVQDISCVVVKQAPLSGHGDGLFKRSSGVDQSDLVEQVPWYYNKKMGMKQLKTVLSAGCELECGACESCSVGILYSGMKPKPLRAHYLKNV
jgi:hypothetical protein